MLFSRSQFQFEFITAAPPASVTVTPNYERFTDLSVVGSLQGQPAIDASAQTLWRPLPSRQRASRGDSLIYESRYVLFMCQVSGFCLHVVDMRINNCCRNHRQRARDARTRCDECADCDQGDECDEWLLARVGSFCRDCDVVAGFHYKYSQDLMSL